MRWPGARMAPTTSNWACRHTRDENSGANGARRVIISAGRVIIGNLFSQEWLPRLSCFPPLTLSLHICSRLGRQAGIEGVGIHARTELLLDPAQEVLIMELLEDPAGLTNGDVALLLLHQARPLLLQQRIGRQHQR